MGLATRSGGSLSPSHFITFCPPPLRIQKKPRRITFRRRVLRKPTRIQSGGKYLYGPLDDIIDDIKCDIWHSPPCYGFELNVLDWNEPLRPPPPCTINPLPVSRTPSDNPLKVHKNRNSRSSASYSSMGDATSSSRNNSHDRPGDRKTLGAISASDTVPWPSFDERARATDPAADGPPIDCDATQQSLDTIVQRGAAHPEPARQRRPSRLRLITNGLSRLRRTATEESNTSNTSSTIATPITSPEDDDNENVHEPSDEAVEAYVRKNARNSLKLRNVMERVAKRLPAPVEHMDEVSGDSLNMPTTLRAAVRMYPEAKVLREGKQDLNVAIEVEGMLHNRNMLPDTTIDAVFMVDNGYYVSKDCLANATDAVSGALHHLRRGDRIALYTTHCTHNTVSGNRPEQHFPLRPFNADTDGNVRALTADIGRHGTQAWQPPRPNPSMTEVVLSVARSLEHEDLKNGRTHFILLSPAAYVLHDVSKTLPDLFIHRLNPAIMPFRREPEVEDTVCYKSCCTNVFVSNWNSHQSVPSCIKRILKNARSKSPLGTVSDVTIDVRTREGCQILDCLGTKDIPSLRLGQVHTLIARIRIDTAHAKPVDLDSVNPIFNSSLDVKGLRQDLQNAVAVGAVKVHLLDVQLYYRNSLHATNTWNYTETPLLIIRDLGGLAPPPDIATEVYLRQYFQVFSQVAARAAAAEEVDDLLARLNELNGAARGVIECMAKEADYHGKTLRYESEHRQKLPLCPGPITNEMSHEWLQDVWNKNKVKRKGMPGVKKERITNFNNDNGRDLERLKWI